MYASTSLLKDTPSLTLILIAIIVIGLTMAAAVLCLPLLMGITLVHHVNRSRDDAIDSSIISIRETQDLDLLNATALEES